MNQCCWTRDPVDFYIEFWNKFWDYYYDFMWSSRRTFSIRMLLINLDLTRVCVYIDKKNELDSHSSNIFKSFGFWPLLFSHLHLWKKKHVDQQTVNMSTLSFHFLITSSMYWPWLGIIKPCVSDSMNLVLSFFQTRIFQYSCQKILARI